ncbi:MULTISPECIES: hypothetical protein [Chryseobacterium]|uniref:Uncharacterized protein n=1 Tax=Candidatus Chryseobacterium massiliense TaxID=204089 RepID=A0A3D9BAI9_9FLAO|nr:MULTISPECIES: hypothetical protein [Chryseobacterium]REC50635.1 hypothetical protein DRF68_09065 [Candidatus Chryseobacterium massiliae]
MPVKLIENPDSINNVADWAEFYVFASNDNLSKSELSSYIEDSSGSEPDQAFIDDIWLELERRLFLYGNPPPFILETREIIPLLDWTSAPEYLTCLILSIDGNSVDSVKTGKLFERLSSKAISNYFNGNSIIYGHPSRQTIRSIASQMSETFVKEPSTNYKDRGVDIICWKPFSDNRKSQIAVLIQCAAGFNWDQKLLGIPHKAWMQYIHWGADPLKGFTAPIVITEKRYDDIVTDAGIMFDRARIYQNVQYQYLEDNTLIDDLKAWCRPKIESFINS